MVKGLNSYTFLEASSMSYYGLFLFHPSLNLVHVSSKVSSTLLLQKLLSLSDAIRIGCFAIISW